MAEGDKGKSTHNTRWNYTFNLFPRQMLVCANTTQKLAKSIYNEKIRSFPEYAIGEKFSAKARPLSPTKSHVSWV